MPVTPSSSPDAAGISAEASIRLRAATSPWALVLLLVLGGVLAIGSAPLGMLDQGDYARTVSRVVGEPLPAEADAAKGAPATRWSLREGMPIPNPSSGTSSFLFAAAAALQSLYQDRFDLLHLGLAGKFVLVAALGLLAFMAARRQGFGAIGQGGLVLGLLLAAFAAHNIGFLQSLYGEYSFFLGLPLLLAALLWPPGRGRLVLLVVSLLMCGGAKAQFFYLPLLVLPVLWWQARAAGHRPDGLALAAILVVQGACLAPLAISDVMDFNRHHSTHLGSYLAMTESERDRLGLTPAERACIGVDAWGNRLESLDAVQYVPDSEHCSGTWPKSLLDTLRPYAVAPGVAWRMLTVGLPPHLTVRYFHVKADYLYAAPLKADPGVVAEGLQRLTDVRDGLLQPWALIVLLLAALAVAVHGMRRREGGGLAAPMLALVLVALSQVPVALLGEGVRDLSKHLAGAQYAVDLLIVLLLGHLAGMTRRARRRPAADDRAGLA